MNPQASPSPELIFATFNAYQRTAALKTAIELDVFTVIGEGSTSSGDIARRRQASERGMRILCDYLVVIGLLLKEDNRYLLTPDSAAFLDRRSPACLATAVRFLNDPMFTGAFADLTTCVRKGGAVFNPHGTLAPSDPLWVEFARSMAPMMSPASEGIAELVGASTGPLKVLDIAAGHGLFGIAIARRNPAAAVVALDWPNVLAVARENARAAGLADHRFQTLPGSAFDVDFGRDYDVVLLTNFLHHFDESTCVQLLRKVHAALQPAGRAVTLEFVPNEDRVSPPLPASFALMMLGSTPSGDAYTFSEYDQMFRRAGFARSELHPLPPTPQQVILCHKT